MLRYTASRASGPGGQNVNKVNSKVTLTISAEALAEHLPVFALRRLPEVAGRQLATEGLVIVSADSRSQLANRRACLVKLRALLIAAMHRPKVRRATRPSAGAERRRLEAKKRRSAIKRQRSARPDEQD